MISRRRFLSGLGGAMVALPALESVSFFGGRARAAEGANPVYSVFMRQGNGVQQEIRGREPERFWPSSHGALSREILANANSDRAVSELADYADHLLLVSGTRQGWGSSNCDHATGINQCLTAARPSADSGDSLATGESIDWFLSQRVNPDGQEPLNLLSGRQGIFLAHGLSYSGPERLRGASNNPFAVYQDLMGLSGMPDEVLQAIARRRKSVNDLVRGEMQDLLGKSYLSANDRQLLETHFEVIRDIETTMSCTLTDSEVQTLEDISDAADDNGNRVSVAELMTDLIALAFSCDANRVATLQVGNGSDGTRYVVNGREQNTYHRISHRIDSDGSNGDPIPDADLLHHEIDRIHARIFKHLLDRLSMYTTSSGTPLLDNTVALWTNDLGSGPPHSHNNIPQVIAGKGGGFLKTGQYIDAGNVTHNKLLNTLISAAGVCKDDGSPWDSFGDSSLDGGIIPEMIA